MTPYFVGFDRFISLEWANHAFELSSEATDARSKNARLKSWLASRVSGKESIRKTANVLSRLWIEPKPDVNYFRQDAYGLALNTSIDDYVLFHWGMALLVFPVFQETCIHIGRLTALQSTINRREIHSRIAEKYSNQSTIPRSVDRIFQTLLAWELLVKNRQREYELSVHYSDNKGIKRWLLEIVTFSAPTKRLTLSNSYRIPQLFPFDVNGETRQLVQESLHLRLERDGSNSENIVWT